MPHAENLFQNFFRRMEAFQSASPRPYRRLAMKLAPRGFAICAAASVFANATLR